jgi:hypothetical protein
MLICEQYVISVLSIFIYFSKWGTERRQEDTQCQLRNFILLQMTVNEYIQAITLFKYERKWETEQMRRVNHSRGRGSAAVGEVKFTDVKLIGLDESEH